MPVESARSSARIAVIVLLVCLMAGGCAARINRFVVAPHHLCSGTAVRVDWDAAGRASLTTDPPLQPQAGGRTYAPSTSTVFTLTAKRWPRKPAVSQAEATVLQTGAGAGAEDQDPDELPFQMSCSEGRLVGTLTRPVSEWDRLLVGTLESDGEREIVVAHDGKEVRLSTRTPSTTAFEGMALGGTWTVTAPLLAPEACGSTTHPPPDLFVISAHVRCGSRP